MIQKSVGIDEFERAVAAFEANQILSKRSDGREVTLNFDLLSFT